MDLCEGVVCSRTFEKVWCVQGPLRRRVFSDLCEDVVGLAEDPAGVGIGGNQQLQRADVDVGAKCPEVRLLQVVYALQLLHLKATQRG